MGSNALAGNVAIVTGGAYRLGKGIAMNLSDKGAIVIVFYIGERNGQEVVDLLKENDK